MDWSNFLFFLVSLCSWTLVVSLQKNIYMDSNSFCNKPDPYTVYDFDLLVVTREQVTGSNSSLRCEITLETGYTNPYYGLEIRQEAVAIGDCAFRLEIYSGQSDSRPLKTLSCNSKSTGVLYSDDRYAKLILIQPQDLYQPANNFTLRIRTWPCRNKGMCPEETQDAV